MVLAKKAPAKKAEAKKSVSNSAKLEGKNQSSGKVTRVVVRYDVGVNNDIYIRGKGANLSWEKGIKLKNTRPDEWVWETKKPFKSCEFKVLVNDTHYEHGDNRLLTCENSVVYTPTF